MRCLSAIQQVGHTDCICRRCAEDLRKHSHSSDYVPVWKGGRRTSRVATQCYVIKIDTTCSNAAPPDAVQLLLGQEIGSNSNHLCPRHYQQVYRALTQPLPCAACGRKPNKKQHFNRKCPNPEFVNRYLQRHCCIVSTPLAQKLA